MNERDCYTVEAMEKMGGSFVKALALLARLADPINLKKIKDTWPEYWNAYEQHGLKIEAKQTSRTL